MKADDGRHAGEYLPIYALPYWSVIGEFVHSMVDECAALTERDVESLFAATTPFVLWCWQSRGIPLERQRIFRSTVIDEFIHLGLTFHVRGSKATLRSSLWRMLEVVNPIDAASHRRPIPRSEPTSPYSADDVACLHSWAISQSSPRRQRDAIALLALGLGAGLATRELLEVTAKDIGITGDTVRVMVWASRPRVVPVLTEWCPPILRHLSATSGDSWIFCPGRTGTHPNQVTNFLTRSRTTLDIRPSRMRATWLLQNLEAGLAPQELLRISGLKNFAALDKIMQFAPKTGASAVRRDLA